MKVIESERLAFLDGVAEEKTLHTVASMEARGWGTNNSDFEAYCVDLALPDYPQGFAGIVEEAIGKNPNNVGMDLAGGSDGIALQDLLRDGILGTAIVTNYEDRRTSETKQNKRLLHIAGDLVKRSTWEDIIYSQKKHAPDGLALVMHRPVGGLQNLRPAIYRNAAHLLLDMTRSGGVLFLQIPDALIAWTAKLELDIICASIESRDDIERIIPSYIYPGALPILDSVVIVKR